MTAAMAAMPEREHQRGAALEAAEHRLEAPPRWGCPSRP